MWVSFKSIAIWVLYQGPLILETLIWEYPMPRGPNTDPKGMRTIKQGHPRNGPRFLQAAISILEPNEKITWEGLGRP